MKAKVILYLFLLASFIPGLQSTAQNAEDPVLMTVAGNGITKSEFLNIYQKNNVKGEVIDKKSLDEYVELFINFKLKVKEAEELGMDTIGTFVTELAGYRKQLAQKYLVDEEVDERLMKEAYSRMQKDIRASHILIKCEPGASPKDTLAAYQKAVELRNRILKGESFENLAKEFSDDLSARDREAGANRPFVKGNGGDLGYFTVFDMVYPFETAAYTAKAGEVSMPVRTDYGYHLIRVTESKKAMGRARVAHIFASLQQAVNAEDSAAARTRINEAWAKLQEGKEWDTVARNLSDDKGTAAKGGILPWFGVNRMVPEFITVVSRMEKIGDVTAPFTTPFGWHIVKLIDKKEIGPYEDLKPDLKQKVSRDSRSHQSKEAMVEKIKKQYGFQEYPAAKDALLPFLDSTYYQGTWLAAKAEKLKGTLFSLGEKHFTQDELARYLEKEQKIRTQEDFSILLNNVYKKFREESCISFKDSRLESEYPEFKNLMKEYRDGILLFDLTDKKVWSKAVKDTTGLEAYHAAHKSDYMWPERADVTLFKSKDQQTIEKAWKLVSKQMKKGGPDTLALFRKVNRDQLKAEYGKFVKGDNKWIDTTPWEKGIYPVSNADGSWYFVIINQKLAPEPKTLSEARGLVTADYQNYLEKAWITELRAKYPVKVNQEVLSTIQ